MPAIMNRFVIALLLLSTGLTSCGGTVLNPQSDPTAHCLPHQGWVAPNGKALEASAVIAGLAAHRIVLLGESHDSKAHHDWQLDTLKLLFAVRPDMVLGLEMFPRKAQPALDDWVAGRLTEARFLEKTGWREGWRFDPALYMGIFRFAREHRIEMRALNVDSALIRAVSRDGLESTPQSLREGVGNPAPPSPAYRQWLAGVMAEHPTGKRPDERRSTRFVQAQQVWDRAMAEGLAQASNTHDGALVVGIMGSGHIIHGFGVPHQLRDLGVGPVATALPWDADKDCNELLADAADVIFAIRPETGLGNRR